MFILDVTNEPKVLWECKHCAQMNEDDIIKFFSANQMKKGLVCVHCKNEFYVGIKLLDTRRLTTVGAETDDTPTASCEHKSTHVEVSKSEYCDECGELVTQFS